MDFIWKAFVMALSGFLLLRLAGRKSIAQLTVATTVVMISIGSIIIQPVVEDSVLRTIGAVAVFIFVLILIEYLELKFNVLETIISGKSKTVIENGQPVYKNLKKLRLSVDRLEMQLRQQGIEKMTDVETATLEPNGQVGYQLKPDAKPLTVGEFKRMVGYLIPEDQFKPQPPSTTIFDEVKNQGHEQPNSKDIQ